MKTNFKACQSCGLPFNSSDIHTNEHFCNYCYENGKFKNPNLTANEMKSMIRERMSNLGASKTFVENFTNGIDNLDRWKNKKIGAF